MKQDNIITSGQTYALKCRLARYGIETENNDLLKLIGQKGYNELYALNGNGTNLGLQEYLHINRIPFILNLAKIAKVIEPKALKSKTAKESRSPIVQNAIDTAIDRAIDALAKLKGVLKL